MKFTVVGRYGILNTRRALQLFCKPNTTYRIHHIILKIITNSPTSIIRYRLVNDNLKFSKNEFKKKINF